MPTLEEVLAMELRGRSSQTKGTWIPENTITDLETELMEKMRNLVLCLEGVQVIVLPTKESMDASQLRLRILYSFLETVSPVKQGLREKLQRLEGELATATDRRGQMKLKAKRSPVASEIISIGKKEGRVVAKAREYYKGITAAGGTPDAPPNRYIQSMK